MYRKRNENIVYFDHPPRHFSVSASAGFTLTLHAHPYHELKLDCISSFHIKAKDLAQAYLQENTRKMCQAFSSLLFPEVRRQLLHFKR